MLIAALLAYTAAILNLGLGVWVFLANRRADANRVFLLMCVMLCCWGIGYTFTLTAPSGAAAMRWRTFSAIGWCFFYSVFLWFAIFFTSYKGWLAKPFIKRILHLPALVFFVYNAALSPEYLTQTELGWIYLYTHEFVSQMAFIIYYTSYSMTAFWLIYRWGKRADNVREKRQARIIVSAMLAVYVLAVPFDTYLPLLGYPVLPVAILLSTIFTLAISYAIVRYKLLTLNFHTAASQILQRMIDPVLLVGTDTVIREVNASFLELTGFVEPELVGQRLSVVIADRKSEDVGRLMMPKPRGKKSEVLLKTSIPTVTVPCLLSSKALVDEFGETLGMILLLHDIGDRKRYEERLRQANDELETKVRDRTAELAESNLSLQQEVLDRTAAETQALYAANFDILTGLPNRRQFCDKANAAIAKAEVFGDTLAVIFVPIGNWVMKQACDQLRRWREQGFEHLTMAVNLSARQLRERDFEDQVKSCIATMGVDPRRIEFEITESMAFAKDEGMASILERMKQNHIALAVDDFGTDYSSFMTIKTVSVDRLKIAQPFISGIGKNQKDEAIVSSIIDLARNLNLKVIAEGVETAEELEYLVQKGCDEIQGYYFHRPMPADKMEALLHSEAAAESVLDSMRSQKIDL